MLKLHTLIADQGSWMSHFCPLCCLFSYSKLSNCTFFSN